MLKSHRFVRSLMVSSGVALSMFGLATFSGSVSAKTLALFGIPLTNANRSTLEPALQKAGLIPIQTGNRWWYDIYRVHGQMPGASKLLVGYTEHNRFAIAQYVFPSFMDTEQVKKVIQMVQDKYGQPSQESGSIGLGSVTAVWNEGNGMEIRVTRGWPSTTTYLDLENVDNRSRMLAQIQAQKAAHEKQQAQAHANAF
jgi:hypothetical protein